MYGGDVFQRGLFVLAPDKGPYKQKFEIADPSMDAKFEFPRLWKKTQHFPILWAVPAAIGCNVEKS
jgi:hypothetical protein